ncbi:hypothetical protein CEUSTIGMA_g4868.t1 [Chlamydomonas eustigma]|uniref:IQCH-like ATP-grasp domain-containing protein n=1 Tax=Chlamydomonas eustigma TaxID=1157962 RepID=A0A250X2W3_9CHLO|nr:hypothetical protein CEUSTIGMA_g4868.t1 [Chlamydomonas eustigma]|eukprot:GAX77423.1 hypothetical protein CEUSTIGMA_g4868.t1 [Chlamydomonas eustigma]
MGSMNPSPSTTAQLPPLDAAKILQQALAELEHVKKQIKQPFMGRATVEASLARLEGDLRAKTHELLTASAEATPFVAATRSSTPPAQNYSLTFRTKTRPLPPVQPSAAERVSRMKSNFMNRPQTEAARQYIQDRFGVPAPKKTIPAMLEAQQGFGPGVVAKGTASVNPPAILPSSIRSNPEAAVPPEHVDKELSKGLMHLVQRGLLHPKADLTLALVGSDAPVNAGGAHIHTFKHQFTRPPPTTALEDSLLAASSAPYKLDLLTSVVPVDPAKAAATAAAAAAMAAERQRVAVTSPPTPRPASSKADDGKQGSRPYDVLMDTFSLHEFMFRMGRAVTTTPEFESYKRTYEPIWDVITVLIGQMETLMVQYSVPLAVVDGKSLADLAQGVVETEHQPQIQDLLLCIQNVQEVGDLLRQPGRRYMGKEGRHSAAATIQAAWRGVMSRRKNSKTGQAAAAIQGAWRTHRMRLQLTERLRQARKERNDRFHQLQQRLLEQWPLLQRHNHVIIHIPNLRRRPGMSVAQSDALLAAECSQLARLCDLAEPLVEVLLLLPSPPDNDVLAYWDKILQVGGVETPSHRYRALWPENCSRLPTHMSTTAKVLSSPTAMKRLKAAVSGRLAYVVPGAVGDEEVDLCVQLNAPLLGPSPSVATVISKKCGARTLLTDAGVIVPPAVHVVPRHQAGNALQQRYAAMGMPLGPPAGSALPLRPNTEFVIGDDGDVLVIEPRPPPVEISRSQYEEDEARVLMLIAEAMARNPWVRKWVLKVDDEVMGCGHASLDLQGIKGAADVLKRVDLEQQLQTHRPPATGPQAGPANPSEPLSDAQRVGAYRINELLYRQLPKHLSLACREVYPTYRDFMSAVAARGGVIEACPDVVMGSPCVNLFVAPTGDTMLLSTHERVFVAPFRAVGSSFPQSSVPHAALAEAALSIGAACYRSGVIGHVCADFVAVRDSLGALRLWSIGLQPLMTSSLLTYQLFDFLSSGNWDPRSGRYQVELEDVPPSTAAGDEVEEVEEPAAQQGGGVGSTAEIVVTDWMRMRPESQEAEGRQQQQLHLLHMGADPATAEAESGADMAGPSSQDPWSASLGGSESGGVNQSRGSTVVTPPRPGSSVLSSQSASRAASPEPVEASPGLELGPRPHKAHMQQQLQQQVPDASGGHVGTTSMALSLPGSAPGPATTQRHFFCLDAITHAGIAASPCSKLFHRAWQEGLYFDVDQRTGVVFNLSEKYIAGVMGLLTVGITLADAYTQMQRALAFVTKRLKEVAAEDRANGPASGHSVCHGGATSRHHSSAQQGSNGAVLNAGQQLAEFKDVQALVKFMVQRSNDEDRFSPSGQLALSTQFHTLRPSSKSGHRSPAIFSVHNRKHV